MISSQEVIHHKNMGVFFHLVRIEEFQPFKAQGLCDKEK